MCDRASRVDVTHIVNGAIREGWHGRKAGKGGKRKNRRTKKTYQGNSPSHGRDGGDLDCRGGMVGIVEPE